MPFAVYTNITTAPHSLHHHHGCHLVYTNFMNTLHSLHHGCPLVYTNIMNALHSLHQHHECPSQFTPWLPFTVYTDIMTARNDLLKRDTSVDALGGKNKDLDIRDSGTSRLS